MAKDPKKAKPTQAPGQTKMNIEEKPAPQRKRHWWNKDNKVVKEKSDSMQTTFETPNGKEFSLETTHGKCVRYQEEIASGVSNITGETLSDADIAYRKGVVHTLAAQARAYNKRLGN